MQKALSRRLAKEPYFVARECAAELLREEADLDRYIERAVRIDRDVWVVEIDDPEVDGVIFVQMDGVPFPVLRWAVLSGAVATIRRWVTSGDYVLHEWTPQLPCTTPASQVGSPRIRS